MSTATVLLSMISESVYEVTNLGGCRSGGPVGWRNNP
jgi:hypothetical protein